MEAGRVWEAAGSCGVWAYFRGLHLRIKLLQPLLAWFRQKQQLHQRTLLLLRRGQDLHQQPSMKVPSSLHLPMIQCWLWLGHCSEQGCRVVERVEKAWGVTRMARDWVTLCTRRVWGSLAYLAWGEMVLQGANTSLVGDVKKVMLDPLQRCTARRQGATDSISRKINASSVEGKKILQGFLRDGRGCPEKLRNLHPWRYPTLSWKAWLNLGTSHALFRELDDTGLF